MIFVLNFGTWLQTTIATTIESLPIFFFILPPNRFHLTLKWGAARTKWIKIAVSTSIFNSSKWAKVFQSTVSNKNVRESFRWELDFSSHWCYLRRRWQWHTHATPSHTANHQYQYLINVLMKTFDNKSETSIIVEDYDHTVCCPLLLLSRCLS